MTHELRLGAIFRPQLPPERLRRAVRVAEETGLDELWLWEDCFLESGFSTAAAALAWSDRITVGIGLIPVPLRNVAITAMEIATLERLFPGRLRLAVGHGVQDWMAQVGARAESPLGLMREYVAALRALLSGEDVTTSGRYVTLDAVQLGWPPATAPALLMGAVGPRSLTLCGEVADGVLVDSITPTDGLGEALELVNAGWSSSGRVGAPQVAAYTRTFAEDDSELPAAVVAADAWARHRAGAQTIVLQPSGTLTNIEGYFTWIRDEVRPLIASQAST